MNKLTTLAGALTIAAALAMTTTSCSSENDIVENSVQTTATSTMHVTVGAGISDGTITRATVDDSQTDINGKTLRTLKFTEGDQLFVHYNGEIEVNGITYGYDIYGTLTTTSSNIGEDGLTAQFSGNLTVNKWFAFPSEGEIPDPDLSKLDGYAMLILADHGSSIVREEDPDHYSYNYCDGFTATETLNEVIARHSLVEGVIDASQNVTLTAKSCILNCTVTGLEASTAYDVRMAMGADPVSITTDGEGKLKFVFWTRIEEDPEHNVLPMGFAFYIGNNKRMLTGEKTLAAGKVYNVTRAAVDFTPLTVTDNLTDKTVEPEWGSYYFKDAADITVTGVGEGETIRLSGSNNTVTLSGVTAMSHNEFIYGEGKGEGEGERGTLNIVLSGTNSITITDPEGGIAIDAFGNNLKLSGNGTLTVTVHRNDFYGLRGNNYAYNGDDPNTPDTNGDASVLADDGYLVSRSERTDNADGTYTWTYTVSQLVTFSLNAVTKKDGNGVKYYAAQDGQTLTGYFDDEYGNNEEGYITIADGATVTLAGVDIQAPDGCDHAAIHCLGDATIILDHKTIDNGENNVVNAGTDDNSSSPAIYVPAGKTLTISGTDDLVARGSNSAGIGGGAFYDCGNIEITGGNIVAIGGYEGGAGIGSGLSGQCGNITISGGTIEATGGSNAAGIGCGSSGQCGNITISGGTIEATGDSSAAGIGCGSSGYCGNITITDGITQVLARKGTSTTYYIYGRSGDYRTVTISGVTMTDDELLYRSAGEIGNLWLDYFDQETLRLSHQ